MKRELCLLTAVACAVSMLAAGEAVSADAAGSEAAVRSEAQPERDTGAAVGVASDSEAAGATGQGGATASAGMRAYADPSTGKLIDAPVNKAEPPALRVPPDYGSVRAVIVGPDRVEVVARIRMAMTASATADGSIVYGCGQSGEGHGDPGHAHAPSASAGAGTNDASSGGEEER